MRWFRWPLPQIFTISHTRAWPERTHRRLDAKVLTHHHTETKSRGSASGDSSSSPAGRAWPHSPSLDWYLICLSLHFLLPSSSTSPPTLYHRACFFTSSCLIDSFPLHTDKHLMSSTRPYWFDIRVRWKQEVEGSQGAGEIKATLSGRTD